MRDCFEKIGEVIAIHLFSPGELKVDIPFNVLSDFYRGDDIKVGLSEHSISIDDLIVRSGIAIDTYYNNIPSGSIIMEHGVSIKESAKSSVAGMVYTTKISAKTLDVIEEVKGFVNNYSELEYFDALIVDSNYNLFIVRGAEPSTSITMSASLPLSVPQSIDIEVISINGIIPIVVQSP